MRKIILIITIITYLFSGCVLKRDYYNIPEKRFEVEQQVNMCRAISSECLRRINKMYIYNTSKATILRDVHQCNRIYFDVYRCHLLIQQ